MIGKVAERRAAKTASILDEAWAIAERDGIAGLTLRGLARELGMSQPSLYEYFDSKHALYDALFADGNRRLLERLDTLRLPREPRRAVKAYMRTFTDFALESEPRRQLLFERPIPRFEPSAPSYEAAERVLAGAVVLLAAAGIDDPDDVDCVVAVVGGVIAAQASNQPGGTRWTRHLDRLVDLLLDHPEKERPMIQQLDHDEVRLHMHARPDDVYALVADVTRTPEFSPEILECRWLDGATGPTVGARFRARNKVPKRPSWSNSPVVTVVEPGRRFAFARTEPFGGTVEWTYAFEHDGEGTLVTESYEVTKPLGRVGWFIIGALCARTDRRADLRAGMEETLQRLGRAVETQDRSASAS